MDRKLPHPALPRAADPRVPAPHVQHAVAQAKLREGTPKPSPSHSSDPRGRPPGNSMPPPPQAPHVRQAITAVQAKTLPGVTRGAQAPPAAGQDRSRGSGAALHVQNAIAQTRSVLTPPSAQPRTLHPRPNARGKAGMVQLASEKNSGIEKFLSYQPEDYEDFEQYYHDPEYDEEDETNARNAASKVFGKTWENLTEEDLVNKEKDLIKRAKAAQEEDVSQIQYELSILNIAIAFKVKDPQRQKKHYTQSDRVTQALAQE
jgi:hypothetical protein